MNSRGCHSNFVDCESFLESNPPDIFTLCGTNLDDSIDSGNFSAIFSFCMVFDSISSNIDKVHLINPAANVFVFGDFNVHHVFFGVPGNFVVFLYFLPYLLSYYMRHNWKSCLRGRRNWA